MLKVLPKAVVNEGLEVIVYKNGNELSQKLEGLIGYNNIMINAPHYMLILGNKEEIAYKMTGYLGEWLVLKLIKEDIGSCWVDLNGNDIGEKLGLNVEKDVLGIIAMGYPKSDLKISAIYNSKKRMGSGGYPNTDLEYKEDNTTSRKPIEDIVFLSKWGNKITVNELEVRGYAEVFYYMRLAPSWVNRQPWKFILDGTKIVLYIEKDEKVAKNSLLLESGIAMLYFEVAMHGEGIPGYWKLEKIDDEDKYGVPDNYYYVGYYTF